MTNTWTYKGFIIFNYWVHVHANNANSRTEKYIQKQPDFKIKLVIHFDVHDNVKTTSPSIEIIILSDNEI